MGAGVDRPEPPRRAGAQSALALLAAAVICVVIRGWEPPFSYRTGYTPPRDIVATVAFNKADDGATQAAREQARSQTRYVYVQDAEAAGAASGQVAKHAGRTDRRADVGQARPEDLGRVQVAAAGGKTAADGQGTTGAVPRVSRRLHPAGIAGSRREGPGRGLCPFRAARTAGQAQRQRTGRETRKRSSSIRRATPNCSRSSASATCCSATAAPSTTRCSSSPSFRAVADRLFAWLQPRLKAMKATLTVDDQRTKEAMDEAGKAVAEVFEEYSVGQTLAKAGQPLDHPEIACFAWNTPTPWRSGPASTSGS